MAFVACPSLVLVRRSDGWFQSQAFGIEQDLGFSGNIISSKIEWTSSLFASGQFYVLIIDKYLVESEFLRVKRHRSFTYCLWALCPSPFFHASAWFS